MKNSQVASDTPGEVEQVKAHATDSATWSRGDEVRGECSAPTKRYMSAVLIQIEILCVYIIYIYIISINFGLFVYY